jgi:hypothetical protein
MKRSSHWKRSDNVYGPLLPVGAERHTGSAKPALLRVHLYGRFPLFWIRSKGITHANLNTGVAPGTRLVIEVDVSETHFKLPLGFHRRRPDHVRKCSPVGFLFQRTLCINGRFNRMAPERGHSSTQHPPYQHSSGYRMIGGFPFSGLGMNTSNGQISTQRLHPLQISGSKITGLPGPGRLGTA